jgi:hypothetical protein
MLGAMEINFFGGGVTANAEGVMFFSFGDAQKADDSDAEYG